MSAYVFPFQVDTGNTGRVLASDAAVFLKKSGLPDLILGKVIFVHCSNKNELNGNSKRRPSRNLQFSHPSSYSNGMQGLCAVVVLPSERVGCFSDF